MKSKYVVSLLLILTAVLAGVLMSGRHSRPAGLPVARVITPAPVVSVAPSPVAAAEVAVSEKITGSAGTPEMAPLPSAAPKQLSTTIATGKAPAQDPDARIALALVGADPEAEQYWAAAINDPTLPAEERKDLIEDLNEDGLSDPKHPGPQDMPLIYNRIRLIEEMGPNAMDPVNARAFDEAYKDLLNLASGGPAD